MAKKRYQEFEDLLARLKTETPCTDLPESGIINILPETAKDWLRRDKFNRQDPDYVRHGEREIPEILSEREGRD